jgi:hypothetical protein
MKLNVAINLSKLVGSSSKNHTTDFSNLRQSLEFICAYAHIVEDRMALSNPSNERSTFAAELEASANRLFIVIRDSNKLAHYRFDPEMTADLFYQISNGYTDSPELRMTWLQNISFITH